ncbi:hypothetical protein N8085_06280, partial [Salibacteraceae bacterium]|nr:hypothetical protein [Salibacteraceae bacterium]
QIKAVVKADNVHFPKSTLVSLENTCNKAGCLFSCANPAKDMAQNKVAIVAFFILFFLKFSSNH